jgi:hypothetical protein
MHRFADGRFGRSIATADPGGGMIEAQTMISQGERLHRERSDPAFIHDRFAQVGTERQVLHAFIIVAEKAPDVADFEKQSPDNVSQHIKAG